MTSSPTLSARKIRFHSGDIANEYAALSEQILSISMAQVESVVGPDGIADDIGRKSVAFERVYRQIIHPQRLTCQYQIKYYPVRE